MQSIFSEELYFEAISTPVKNNDNVLVVSLKTIIEHQARVIKDIKMKNDELAKRMDQLNLNSKKEIEELKRISDLKEMTINQLKFNIDELQTSKENDSKRLKKDLLEKNELIKRLEEKQTPLIEKPPKSKSKSALAVNSLDSGLVKTTPFNTANQFVNLNHRKHSKEKIRSRRGVSQNQFLTPSSGVRRSVRIASKQLLQEFLVL